MRDRYDEIYELYLKFTDMADRMSNAWYIHLDKGIESSTINAVHKKYMNVHFQAKCCYTHLFITSKWEFNIDEYQKSGQEIFPSGDFPTEKEVEEFVSDFCLAWNAQKSNPKLSPKYLAGKLFIYDRRQDEHYAFTFDQVKRFYPVGCNYMMAPIVDMLDEATGEIRCNIKLSLNEEIQENIRTVHNYVDDPYVPKKCYKTPVEEKPKLSFWDKLINIF